MTTCAKHIGKPWPTSNLKYVSYCYSKQKGLAGRPAHLSEPRLSPLPTAHHVQIHIQPDLNAEAMVCWTHPRYLRKSSLWFPHGNKGSMLCHGASTQLSLALGCCRCRVSPGADPGSTLLLVLRSLALLTLCLDLPAPRNLPRGLNLSPSSCSQESPGSQQELEAAAVGSLGSRPVQEQEKVCWQGFRGQFLLKGKDRAGWGRGTWAVMSP